MSEHKYNNPSQQKGFTIPELLVSVFISSVIGFIMFGYLFNQYTFALAQSARMNLRTSGQIMLMNLQDELLFAISYGETTDPELVDLNEPSGGWQFDAEPFPLIISEIALNSRRQASDRKVLRRETNPCASSAITSNNPAIINIIYFLEDVPGSPYNRLVKRTIVPTYSLCGIHETTGDPCNVGNAGCSGMVKETTCPAGDVGSGGCTAIDSVLNENVISMSQTYLDGSGAVVTFPSSATMIQFDLLMGDRVYGRDVEVELTHTVRKIN